MKEAVEKIVGYVLGVLAILCIMFAIGSFKYGHIRMGIIALCIVAVPWACMCLHIRMEVRNLEKMRKKRIRFLRTKGIALKADLSRCRIDEEKSTVCYERADVPAYSFRKRLYPPDEPGVPPEIPEQTTENQAANAGNAVLFGDIYHQRYSYDHCVCTVCCDIEYKGKTATFTSDPILMDKASLGVMLALHGEGTVYVNPKDAEDYFFDLDFLGQEEDERKQ